MMKTNQRLVAVVVVVMMTMMLFALCASTVLAQEPEYIMNIGTIATKDTPWGKQLKLFKKTVEKESGERIKVKLAFGGKLGDEVSLMRQLKRGDIQGFAGTTAAIATLVPEVAVFELCGLFDSLEEADRIIDEALTAPVASILEDNGFVFYSMGENGFRHFATKGVEIHGPDDLKGLKMRAQESWVHEEMYRALGGNPVQMPVSEVPTSLATSNIDGFDNTPLYASAAQWYKNVDTWTVSEHIYQPAMIVYNKAWVDGLPDDLKAAVMAGADKQRDLGRKLVRAVAPKLLENLEAAGLKVYKMTAAEKKVIADRCKKVVHPMFVKKVGGRGQELMDAIKKAKK